jgi:hypothetical protein
MMKIFSKFLIPGVLIVIHVLIWGALLSDSAFAGHSNQVLSVVESARQKGIPEDILEYLLAYSIDNSVAPDHVVTVIQILVNVKESGLKLAPFQDMIREGIAKHVTLERIEKGLNELWSDHLFARELLAEKSRSSSKQTEAAFQSLVESLELGLGRQELRELCEGAPTVSLEMLAVAARNKAYLIQIGFDAELTDKILSTGLANASFTPGWASFYRLAAASKRKGASEDMIAHAAIEALKQNEDMRNVMKKLGFIVRDVRHGPHQGAPVEATEEN